MYQPVRDQPFAHLTNQRPGQGPRLCTWASYWSVWPPCSDWGSPSSTAWCLMSGDRGHSPASTGTPGLAWQQRTMFVCGLVVVFSRLYGYEWWCLRQLSALIIIKSEILLRQINRLAVWKWGHEGLWDQWPGLWPVQCGLSVTHCTLWGPVHCGHQAAPGGG